jgi:hypothetical protein
VARWLGAFGPGTEVDLRWWTGLGAGPVRAALAALRTEEVELDDGRGYVLPGDTRETDRRPPAAVLLPALDATPMGWKERRWFLGDHGDALFDRSGNIGPTVWWDGRIVGGWALREGEVLVRLLEDCGAEARASVDAEAERLTAWLGPVRFVNRFPTPLVRELLGGSGP